MIYHSVFDLKPFCVCPCRHCMARPRVAFGEDGFVLYRVGDSKLHKKSLTAD